MTEGLERAGMPSDAPRMAAMLHDVGEKEWVTFDTVGAFMSHLSMADPLGTCAVPVEFQRVQRVSDALWKRLQAGCSQLHRGM